MTKERYDMLKDILKLKDTEIIKSLVNKLIDNLYKPVKEKEQFVVDKRKLKLYKLEGELLNWGNLNVVDVEKKENKYIVIVEEAAENDCKGFCNYIESFMSSWGWNCEVKTEW